MKRKKTKRKQTAWKDRKVTRRESALLEHPFAGSSITTAARKVGFSKKWPGQAGYQAYKNIQRKMPKLLDELGLSYKARFQGRQTAQEKEQNAEPSKPVAPSRVQGGIFARFKFWRGTGSEAYGARLGLVQKLG